MGKENLKMEINDGRSFPGKSVEDTETIFETIAIQENENSNIVSK